MTLTTADYERALHAFSQDLAPADKQIAAAYLFGSMAQGRLQPGVSDLDFWVFLEPGVLADRHQFGNVLQTLATATRALRKRGIPVENACGYAGLEEMATLPPLVVSNLGAPAATQSESVFTWTSASGGPPRGMKPLLTF